MTIKSTKTIKNGGIEQAFLEISNEDGLLNEADKKSLEHLQSLPQDRVEVINEYQIKHNN
jgi:hypothetical protein